MLRFGKRQPALAGRPVATFAAVVFLVLSIPDTHTVQPGDNLTRIASRHGLSVRAIAEANGIRDPDRIYVGQRLSLPGVSAAGPPARAAERAEVGNLIERTARRHGWSPAFVKALAWQESGWRQDVVSEAGAIGIMQVLPSTGRFVSQRLITPARELDLSHPADNVEAGVVFLDHLHGLAGGEPAMILAGYYQGLASVSRNGLYPETERFIANVLALRERFR